MEVVMAAANMCAGMPGVRASSVKIRTAAQHHCHDCQTGE
jgi:hypothetical protein